MPNYIPKENLPEYINCSRFEVACAVRTIILGAFDLMPSNEDSGMYKRSDWKTMCFRQDGVLLSIWSQEYYPNRDAREFTSAQAFLDFITVKPLMVGGLEIGDFSEKGFRIGSLRFSWEVYHAIGKLDPKAVEPVRELHNPQNVPAPKEGCRFLDKDEIVESGNNVMELFAWRTSLEDWVNNYVVDDPSTTYCTPFSREALAKARQQP